MASYSVHYKFSQRFNFPAQEAYQWCTDFQAGDIALMGGKGKRRVTRINDDTLVLTDTVIGEGGKVTRKRLVRLYPELLDKYPAECGWEALPVPLPDST
ncbi:MAG: hypothetical protein ABC585_03815 [Candidatus Methanosuratincola petrocarbonis]|nr:hypothetical protein [Candidatus Methanosuratincola sp.]